MTPEKLDYLRRTFGDLDGGQMQTPACREVARLIFRDGGRRAFPYAGIPTLLAAPARRAEPGADLSGLDVGLFGVPLDLGVTNRSGARFGPRALRTIERIGPYNEALGVCPVHQMAVADLGDVPFGSRFDLAASHAEIEAFARRLVEGGVVPVAVGGDHSISHPILRAVGDGRPVGMVHIDAHCDTGGPFEGERFHHGGPFRNAVLDGVLDPDRVIQIGMRGSAEYIWEFSRLSGMTVVPARDVDGLGIPRIIEMARAVVGDGPFYLSFDIDGIDPAFAPGTGTPEVGGLTPREALALIRGLAGLDIVGGDVVEVAPAYDANANTAHVAAQVLFEIVSLVCVRRSRPGVTAGEANPQDG